MSEQWESYFARVNDVLASIFLDVAAGKAGPHPTNSWLHWVWVGLCKPRDDGLSDSDEAPRLYEIEDVLRAALHDSVAGSLVGRITTAGRREFYFYGASSDGLEHAVTSAIRQFPAYRVEFGTKFDKEWSHYFNVLYPSQTEWQRIKNGHVLDSLEKQGDRHERPRPVRHWAYFPSAEDREGFLARVGLLGFGNVERGDTDGVRFRHGARFERTDRVEWDHINDVTVELLRMAMEENGEYDGWETRVESDG